MDFVNFFSFSRPQHQRFLRPRVDSHLVVGGDHPHWQSVGVPADAKRVSAAVRHGRQVLLVAAVTRRGGKASHHVTAKLNRADFVFLGKRDTNL